MLYILIIGIISAIFGLLLIFSPKTILNIERQANRVIITDPFFIKYRHPLGGLLIVGAIYMIYVYIAF
ncbi:MAG: hypothetical protein ACKVHA_09070 [Fidelibacterota bacterium]|mgnify:FL=1